MLRMGFIEDVQWILEHTPDSRQVALFSATMPHAIQRVADTYLKDLAEIRIESKTSTVERIEQNSGCCRHEQTRCAYADSRGRGHGRRHRFRTHQAFQREPASRSKPAAMRQPPSTAILAAQRARPLRV